MKIILVTEFFYCGQKIMYNGLQLLALQNLRRDKTNPEKSSTLPKSANLKYKQKTQENHSSENWAKPFSASTSPQCPNSSICKTTDGKALGLKAHPGRPSTHLQLLQQSLHDVQEDIPGHSLQLLPIFLDQACDGQNDLVGHDCIGTGHGLEAKALQSVSTCGAGPRNPLHPNGTRLFN